MESPSPSPQKGAPQQRSATMGSSPTSRQRTLSPSLSSAPSTPGRTTDGNGESRRAAPEVEEKWREASGIKSKDEVLYGDFQCSYTGDLITSQGHLYLSTNYLCFYSGLGAISMKKVLIPWTDVRAVEKTITNYDHTSGIKITQKDATTLRHFTQFSSRDKVYDCIMKIWTRALKGVVDGGAEKTEPSSPSLSAAHEAKKDTDDGDSAPLLFGTPTKKGAALVTKSVKSPSPPTEPESRSKSSSSSSVMSTPESKPSAPTAPLEFSGTLPKDASWQLGKRLTVCTHWVEPSSEPLRTVELPYTIDEFVTNFLDDNGAFFNQVHEASGLGGPENCWIKPYPTTVNECCTSRDFNFQQPITTSFPLAPSTTRVKQVHRWFFPAENLLCFGTSSMMPDIPYGSSFSIESKWKIEQLESGNSRVTVHIEGNFFKWLFGFKATVESLIKKDGTAYVQAIIDRMIEQGKGKSSAPKLERKPSFIKPAVIRTTPDQHQLVHAPPKKARMQRGPPPYASLAIVVLLVLIFFGVLYIIVLQRSTYNAIGVSASQEVVLKLRQELALLRKQLENAENLLKLLE